MTVLEGIIVTGAAVVAGIASTMSAIAFAGALSLFGLFAWCVGWRCGRDNTLELIDQHVKHAGRSYESAVRYERDRAAGRPPR
jgi:hypothetical protein